MGLFGRKKASKQLSRREILAQRRAAEHSPAADSGSYRRSRTLAKSHGTGPVESERQAGWQLRQKRRKLLLWLSGSIGGALVVLLLLSQLSATVYIRTPNPEHAKFQDKYVAVLNEYLSVRPLERLRFATDQLAMEQYIINQTPEVRSAELVAGTSLGEGALQLSFRQPTLQWSSGGKTYYVDDLGVTFEQNYFADPAISVKDDSGVPAELGQEVVNRSFLSFLGQAVSLFTQNGLEVSGVVLPDSTVRQVEFQLGGKPYAVKMTVDRSAEEQVNEAMHAIKFIDANRRKPQYIDVRVDQRVFYK